MHVIIWHNPRCSKSRQALALVKNKGIEPTIVEYLTDTPSENDIRQVLVKLGLNPHDIIRKGEAIYKELELSAESSDTVLITAMIGHPNLIERPIVIRGDKARLGRPPKDVLEIL